MQSERGDVVLVLFPDSNLKTAKRRPALVIQGDNLGTGIDQVTVAMITSNLRRQGHPSRISVLLSSNVGQNTGLKTDSVIMTDNIATVFGSAIVRVLGSWKDMTLVDLALRHTLAR